MASINRDNITVPRFKDPAGEAISDIRCGYLFLNAPDKNGKYRVTCMFDKQNPLHMAVVNQIKSELESLLVEAFPNAATRPANPIVAQQPGQGPGSPIKDGDVAVNSDGHPIKNNNPEYAGHYIVTPSSKDTVFVLDGNALPLNPQECRSGYWFKVALNTYAYTGNNNGVTVGLNGVQLIRRDEVFGGAVRDVSTLFAPVAAGSQDPAAYAANAPTPMGAGAVLAQPPVAQPTYQPPAPAVNPAVQPIAQPVAQPVARPGSHPHIPTPGAAPGAEQWIQPPAGQPAPAAAPPVYAPAPAPTVQQPGQPLAQPGSLI